MRTFVWVILLVASPLALAAGGATYPHDAAPIDLGNEASLQRGAKLFVNYCMGCHSLKFQRYGRLARDLEVSENIVEASLIFTADTKVGDTMRIGMLEKEAKEWFGAPPPDLSLIARARGVDYLYNYMRGFYLDETRPFGVNNSVFPKVGMPHALWQLQGWQTPVYETQDAGNGSEIKTISGFELVQAGTMTAVEYDGAIGDLVNFLAYVGEPMQQERKRLGIWVLLFLLLALVVFYLLKQEYWKDVH